MKNNTYRHILHFGLIHLRNLLDLPQENLTRLETARCVAQLLHYIPALLVNSTPGQGDVYFLEVGARDFIRQYPRQTETYFLQTADLILELLESIGPQVTVRWSLPPEID